MEQQSEEKKGYRWYIINTISNYEKKVIEGIKAKIKGTPFEDDIGEFFIPEVREERKTPDGKKKLVRRKMMPGYLLVQMRYSDDLWAHIRNVTGIMRGGRGFNKPIPVKEDELANLRRRLGEKMEVPKIELQKGDKVRVISGPFVDFVGVVEDVNEAQRKLKVTVEVFGRPTYLEVSYDEVEKV